MKEFDVKCYYGDVHESHVCEGNILYSINGSPCKCAYRANLVTGNVDLIGEIHSFATPEWKDAYAKLEEYVKTLVREMLKSKEPDAISPEE